MREDLAARGAHSRMHVCIRSRFEFAVMETGRKGKKLLVFRPYTVKAKSLGISVGGVSAGLSTREKVARTVQTMAKEGADLLLLSVSLRGLMLWRRVPAVC